MSHQSKRQTVGLGGSSLGVPLPRFSVTGQLLELPPPKLKPQKVFADIEPDLSESDDSSGAEAEAAEPEERPAPAPPPARANETWDERMAREDELRDGRAAAPPRRVLVLSSTGVVRPRDAAEKMTYGQT